MLKHCHSRCTHSFPVCTLPLAHICLLNKLATSFWRVYCYEAEAGFEQSELFSWFVCRNFSLFSLKRIKRHGLWKIGRNCYLSLSVLTLISPIQTILLTPLLGFHSTVTKPMWHRYRFVSEASCSTKKCQFQIAYQIWFSSFAFAGPS